VNGYAASCHDAGEIEQAARLALDFIVLGPVLPTSIHPDAPTLGWTGFTALVRRAPLPAYALGGLGPSHLPMEGSRRGRIGDSPLNVAHCPYTAPPSVAVDVHHTRVRRSPCSPRSTQYTPMRFAKNF
jgi:hypothetical protein